MPATVTMTETAINTDAPLEATTAETIGHSTVRPSSHQTPWGRADSAEVCAEGIIFYSTPGHGGVWVSDARLAIMHPAIRACAGRPEWPNWFEEDSEYLLVAWSFPAVFENLPQGMGRTSRTDAASRLMNEWPEAYEAATGEIVPLEKSRKKREAAARGQNHDKFVAVSASGDWHKAVPTGYVGILAALGGRNENGQYAGELEFFLVPRDEYRNEKPEIGFIIDPAKHPLWNPEIGKSEQTLEIQKT